MSRKGPKDGEGMLDFVEDLSRAMVRACIKQTIAVVDILCNFNS